MPGGFKDVAVRVEEPEDVDAIADLDRRVIQNRDSCRLERTERLAARTSIDELPDNLLWRFIPMHVITLNPECTPSTRQASSFPP